MADNFQNSWGGHSWGGQIEKGIWVRLKDKINKINIFRYFWACFPLEFLVIWGASKVTDTLAKLECQLDQQAKVCIQFILKKYDLDTMILKKCPCFQFNWFVGKSVLTPWTGIGKNQ